MRKYLTFMLMICFISVFSHCGRSRTATVSSTVPDPPARYYVNPVISQSTPDPTVIRDLQTGLYFLYGTEDTRNIPIYRSENLVDWTLTGTVFTDEVRPKGNLWAPEICRIKDKYVLFYSLWNGDVWTSLIGYAVADSPQGPFMDKGTVIKSRDIGVEQSIDQYYIEDKGKSYLFWGSFRNIYAVELDITDELVITVKEETKQQITGNAFEGTNIYRYKGYYYLFASIGDFTNDTYRTVVGRSSNLLGPYADKEGKLMLDNGYEVVMGNSEQFYGLGHNAGLVEDDAGQTWMFYHGYERQTKKGRYVFLDKVFWDDQDWPYIQGGISSTKAVIPVIHKDGF